MKAYDQDSQDAFCRHLVAMGKTAYPLRFWVKGTKANNWHGREAWCVWRPDIRSAITTSTYETEAKAQAAADRINRKLYPDLVPA